MLDLSFRVKLQEVKASQLTSKDRTPSALPFFRLDFDGKIVQSPLCEAAGDPNWTGKHKSSFEYRLQEPDLETAIASLSQRSATMAMYFVERSGDNECLVGSCTIDLFTVCTGAVAHSFDLHSPESGKVTTGKVQFMLSMEQQAVVGLSFSNLTASGLPKPTTALLRYNFVSDDNHVQQSGVSAASVDPTWGEVPKILVRTTLRGLMENTLRIFICDVADSQKPMAHVDIPIGETLQSNCDHSVKVTRNAYAEATYQRNFTALVQGTLNFSDFPAFAQFASGSNTNGSVYGRPLLDSCPLPPRYTKMSSGGIAAAAGSETIKIPAHHAPNPNATLVSPSLTGAPPPIASGLLPTPRDNYTVQGGTQPTPGFHTSHVAPIPHVERSQMLHPNATASESFHATRQALGVESRTISPTKRIPSPSVGHLTSIVAPRPEVAVPVPPGPHIKPVIPVSPMGPMAEQLHRQHEEAQIHILTQQQHVTAMKEELLDRTEREERISAATLASLTREEQQGRDELHAVERQLKDLDLANEQGQVEHALSLKQFRAHKTQLEMEMQELLEVEAQLLALQKTVAVHAEEQARAQERARLEAQDARQKTSKDAALFSELDHRWAKRGTSPRAPSPRAISPPRTGSPHQTIVSASRLNSSVVPPPPSSYTQAKLDGAKSLDMQIQQQQCEIRNSPYQLRTRSPPKAISTPPGPSFGLSSNVSGLNGHTEPNAAVFVENLRMAIKAGSSAEFSATMRDYPPAVFQDHHLLHLALNAKDPVTQLSSTNVEIVTMILGARPELLHAVHPTTGNTPLHSACGNMKSGCGLQLVELLVSRGAKAYGSNGGCFNKAGVSPYHVALLNESDEGKLIRRFLVFKGGVDVNQPTATGETPAHLVAVSDRHLSAAQFLKDHGAACDSLAQCPDGNNQMQLMTPAQKAAMYGDAAQLVRDLFQ